MGIRKLCTQDTAHMDSVVEYFEERKQAIINAAGRPLEAVAGGKRKLSQDEYEFGSSKKARPALSAPDYTSPMPLTNGGFTNGVNSNQGTMDQGSPFKQPSPAKRKADEDISKETEKGDINGAKKARPEGTISYPSLTSPNGSETSNIFKSIINNEGSGPPRASDQANGTLSAGPIKDSGTATGSLAASALNSGNPQKSQSVSTVPKAPSGNPFANIALPEPSPLFASVATAKLGSKPFSEASSSSTSDFTSSSKASTSAVPSDKLASFTASPSKPAATTTFGSKPFSEVSSSSTSVFTSPSKASTSGMPSDKLSSFAASPFKPAATSASAFSATPAKSTSEKPKFQPPKFDSAATANFLSQFTKASKESEKKEKEKRKAEDFDSDEDTETDWERKYAEEQRVKKQKLEESTKGKAAKFVAGKGFIFTDEEQNKSTSKDAESEEALSERSSRAPSVSVFDRPSKPMSNGLNIFSHLSEADSGAEGSKVGDADDEDDSSEGSDENEEDQHDDPAPLDDQDLVSQKTRAPTSGAPSNKPSASEPTAKRPFKGVSLFDRISKDETGQPIRELPPKEDRNASGLFGSSSSQFGGSGLFSKSSSATPINMPKKPFTGFDLSTPTATPKSKIFGQSSTPSDTAKVSDADASPGDHTWKADSPIKFGATSVAPSVQITSPSPSKSPFGNLFGSTQGTGSTETYSRPTSGLSDSTPTKGPNVGFGFSTEISSKPSASSLQPPSDAAANDSSRATSPGASSAADSTEGHGTDVAPDEEQEKHEQLDLTKGPGEGDEHTLFEVRAKAFTADPETKNWILKGVGPLRVLKHSETGRTRILMRQDPSGNIVINAALLSSIEYKYVPKKAVRVAIAADTGKLASYLVRIGNDEDAKSLAKILEEQKKG